MRLKIIFVFSMVALLTLITTAYSQVNTPPTGYLDSARYEKGSFQASGWAADKEDGAPVSKVEIYIDKELVGKATLGFVRTDVPKVMKNPAWSKSGWYLGVKIHLKKGMHSSYAVAYDKKNASIRLINEKIFKVE